MRTLSPAVRLIPTRQTGPLSFVGISWLSAYVMLNGSIVAAIALSLHSADLMTVLELFLLVAGSRLGAAGIVLLIGALEYLRASEYSLPEAMRLDVDVPREPDDLRTGDGDRCDRGLVYRTGAWERDVAVDVRAGSAGVFEPVTTATIDHFRRGTQRPCWP